MTFSASLPDAQRNRRSSLPTTSVVSRRGVPRWRLATFSAAGWIVSLRCRQIRTSEMATGAEKPWDGLISTLPSMRGYNQNVSALNGSRRQRSIAWGWSAGREALGSCFRTPLAIAGAGYLKAWARIAIQPGTRYSRTQDGTERKKKTHQGCRYAWISDQETAIRRA